MVSTLFLLIAAVGCYVAALTVSRDTRVVKEAALVGAGTSGGHPTDELPEASTTTRSGRLADLGTSFTRLAVLALTVSLVTRALATGHGPFANQYEFAVAFAWGMIATYAWFEWKYQIRTVALIVLPMAGAMLLYAITVGDTAAPLVPALQNSLLLTVHVAVAVVAYGAFAVASGAAVLYLLQPYFPNLPAAQARSAGGHLLPRDPHRLPAGHDGHHPRRPVGRRGLGLVLELGPEGDREPVHLADLRRLPARPRGARLARQACGLAAPRRVSVPCC